MALVIAGGKNDFFDWRQTLLAPGFGGGKQKQTKMKVQKKCVSCCHLFTVKFKWII